VSVVNARAAVRARPIHHLYGIERLATMSQTRAACGCPASLPQTGPVPWPWTPLNLIPAGTVFASIWARWLSDR